MPGPAESVIVAHPDTMNAPFRVGNSTFYAFSRNALAVMSQSLSLRSAAPRKSVETEDGCSRRSVMIVPTLSTPQPNNDSVQTPNRNAIIYYTETYHLEDVLELWTRINKRQTCCALCQELLELPPLYLLRLMTFREPGTLCSCNCGRKWNQQCLYELGHPAELLLVWVSFQPSLNLMLLLS